MTFAPTPKQALFLWKMITAETPELREPKMSEATPKLDPTKERQPLLLAQFIEKVSRGRASHLVLTDKAWAWAAQSTRVELMQSNSRDGAIALQGLLRVLLPFLQEHGLSLADIVPAHGNIEAPIASAGEPRVDGPSTSGQSLEARIRHVCGQLTGNDRTRAVRVSALRAALADVLRPVLDAELRRMQDAGNIALYRDDNTARVTNEDDRDAVMIGDQPRHILYLKG